MRVLAYCWLAPIIGSSARLVNRTIDDQGAENGSETDIGPQYEPPDQWRQGSLCTTCAMHAPTNTDTPGAVVDTSRVFDHTWHDSTYYPGGPEHTITVAFVGQAVYVFNLIANTIPNIITTTNLSFSLDGGPATVYYHAPDPNTSDDLLYNVLVYSNTSLPPGLHQLRIAAGGPTASLVLFDYIIYT
ncbi:hypothetical protein OH77DRAFT_1375495, partial [Trametes cingulata]